MKTVFDNRQCAHVWAQQTQDSGRSNSMSFSGPTLYSYATPIARIYRGAMGERIVLVTSETYSVTTSGKHMPAMHRALRIDDITFSVPHVDVHSAGDATASDYQGMAKRGTHEANLTYLLAQYDAIKPRLIKARDIAYLTDRDGFTVTYQRLCLYASLFDLPIPHRDPNADWHDVLSLRAERDERNNTPAKIAARERAAAKKVELQAARDVKIAAANGDRTKLWLMGEDVYLSHSIMPDMPTYLRIKGDEVQTSRGARVPVEDAKRVIPLIRRIAQKGKNAEFDTATECAGLRVGHFTVDTIYANGDIQAGCHFIKAAEINRIALELGL